MRILKAVVTAAGKGQRTLPLQTLIDRDGKQKSVLGIIVEEALRAGVEEVCIVLHPGDEVSYAKVAGDHAGRLRFVYQDEPLGYGHAIYCARDFVGGDPFLHLVGDHLYVSRSERGCAQHLVDVASGEDCAVSAVHPTRETLLPNFGAVCGHRLAGRAGLLRIDTVVEKPTPTEAEQRLAVPGMRAGYYLCFFGMHVLTPSVMEILGHKLASAPENRKVTLSDALGELAKREQYLALEKDDWRYDVGSKYGLLNAQLALGLSGVDRDEVITMLMETLTLRERGTRKGSAQ
jgi:UTP--glucose-1-phosphate uridylyltransferase